MPRNEKYDIKPYEPEDDDEYRTPAEQAAREPGAKAGAARSGGVSHTLSWRRQFDSLPDLYVCVSMTELV